MNKSVLRHGAQLIAVLCLLVLGVTALPSHAAAADVQVNALQCDVSTTDNPPFSSTFVAIHDRNDLLVDQGQVSRGQTWGLARTAAMYEGYKESPGGARAVRYFDKARMEIIHPNANPNDSWFVTNGLLVVEMITGKMQYGDNTFSDTGSGAKVPFVGDLNNPPGTYYSDLAPVFHVTKGRSVGSTITDLLGGGTDNTYTGDIATKVDHIDHGFGIPIGFQNFMSQSGPVIINGHTVVAPLYPTPLTTFGLPVTEAFWIKAKVGGVTKDVLFQAFERRILTYTPTNSAQWRVEMGNVGLAYGTWRYGTDFTIGHVPAIKINTFPNGKIGHDMPFNGCSYVRPFENTLSVVIRNADSSHTYGQFNVTTSETANAKGAYDFSGILAFTPPATPTAGYIEMNYASPKDGSTIAVSRRNVTIMPQTYMIIQSPLNRSIITSSGSVTFSGMGTIPFERAYGARLKDSSNHVIASNGFLFGPSGDFGSVAPFSGTLHYSGALPSSSTYVLEVYIASAKDGSNVAFDSVTLCRNASCT